MLEYEGGPSGVGGTMKEGVIQKEEYGTLVEKQKKKKKKKNKEREKK